MAGFCQIAEYGQDLPSTFTRLMGITVEESGQAAAGGAIIPLNENAGNPPFSFASWLSSPIDRNRLHEHSFGCCKFQSSIPLARDWDRKAARPSCRCQPGNWRCPMCTWHRQ